MKNFCLLFLILNTAYISGVLAQNEVVLPDLNRLADLAIEHGSIEQTVGTRPYLENVNVGFQSLMLEENQAHRNVFNAYGMGGAGLTLMPGVSSVFIDGLIKQGVQKNEKITIVGAGVIGIGIAWKLNRAGYTNIEIIAENFPRYSESVDSNLKPLQSSANYPSRVAGGFIMPVSVGPHVDGKVWKDLVVRSQDGWTEMADLPQFERGVYKVPSIVFSNGTAEDLKADKSGIMEVNSLFDAGDELYPESSEKIMANGVAINGDLFERKAAKIQVFENVYQADTLSVLKTMVKELYASKSVKWTQHKISGDSDFANKTKNASVVVNASGSGLSDFLDVPKITPIRGDLVILRIPRDKLSQRDIDSAKQTLWMRNYYLFPRFDTDGKYLEIVLGGSFIKGDASLEPNNARSIEILSTWHDFLHTKTELPDLSKPSPWNSCRSAFSKIAPKRNIKNFANKVMGNLFKW